MIQDALDERLRNRLYKAIFEEFVGPLEFDEDQTLEEDPSFKYNAGVLYPKGSVFALEEGDSPENEPSERSMPLAESGSALEEISGANNETNLDESMEEEPVSLSNARKQSAISMTIAIAEDDRLSVDACAAIYKKELIENKRLFRRIPNRYHLDSSSIILPTRPDKPVKIPLDENGLELWLVFRRKMQTASVVTIALCNSRLCSDDSASCYYQVSFKVSSEKGLVPPVWTSEHEALSDEDARMRLIYRKVNNYAVGHGCATDWEKADRVTWAKTEVMPIAETHPMKPAHPLINGISLALEDFANPTKWEVSRKSVLDVCEQYGKWIDNIQKQSNSLSPEFSKAAQSNIAECRDCLSRMQNGLRILESDPVARQAFHLANEAMYEQYLHYSVMSGERPSIDDPIERPRQWRPFQLAFILINIASMTDEDSKERNIVDLIWFPTGGGKTEAYLGLTAFTLIYERLKDTTSDGVTVFMRYTLRLLTSQQFDRASSLICALESMRRRNPEILGSRKFSIGLWVGSDVSPNTNKEAERLRRKFADKNEGSNPFPVRRCPWCGSNLENDKRKSYCAAGIERNRLVFVCPNEECDFSSSEGLPLEIVDERIYEEPPSLLVGTIDKFAMLPYRHEALTLFGIKEGKWLKPPKLIIQDELHLISGPLGSMAGHYETLISALCERQVNGKRLLPKIVASTATVSRAREQCDQLYACGTENVFQFPPSGIDYDDSFFSVEDKNERGRKYVGVFVPTLKEASTNIRVYSDLMWEPATWKDVPDEWKDRYWTTIGYYGTTRELGQAVTWMGGDIPERLWEHRRRAQKAGDDTVRYVNVPIELTGRKSSEEVKSGLESLSISYPDKRAVDLCFATNMISVGLDISRLGLMVVAGQPKSTAEYIQATSRVGRGDAKGIVFVVYSTTKPRDRSHYENFAMYHQSFYQNVEPSSVTAFCKQVRDRALFGTLAGIYIANTENIIPEAFRYPNFNAFNIAAEIITNRISEADPEELTGAEEDIEYIRERWEHSDFARWSELNPEKLNPATPLMHPTGGQISKEWSGGTFDVPMSMRSVDAECRIAIVGRYGKYE